MLMMLLMLNLREILIRSNFFKIGSSSFLLARLESSALLKNTGLSPFMYNVLMEYGYLSKSIGQLSCQKGLHTRP